MRRSRSSTTTTTLLSSTTSTTIMCSKSSSEGGPIGDMMGPPFDDLLHRICSFVYVVCCPRLRVAVFIRHSSAVGGFGRIFRHLDVRPGPCLQKPCRIQYPGASL